MAITNEMVNTISTNNALYIKNDVNVIVRLEGLSEKYFLATKSLNH